MNEYKPKGGWSRHYRVQAIKEMAQPVIMMAVMAALCILGCDI